jgi:hypothetical protein
VVDGADVDVADATRFVACSRDGQFLAKWPGWPRWKQFEFSSKRRTDASVPSTSHKWSPAPRQSTSSRSRRVRPRLADDMAVSAAVQTGGSSAAGRWSRSCIPDRTSSISRCKSVTVIAIYSLHNSLAAFCVFTTRAWRRSDSNSEAAAPLPTRYNSYRAAIRNVYSAVVGSLSRIRIHTSASFILSKKASLPTGSS